MKKLASVLFLLTLLLSAPCLCDSKDTLERAVTLYKWKYYDDSIVELDKLIIDGKQPWLGRARLLKAFCLIKKDKTVAAEELLGPLAADPDFPLYDYAKLAMADINFDKKNYEVAQVQYKDIFGDSALKVIADIKRADSLYELGKYDKAIDIYNAVIIDYPNSPLLDKARLNLGKCYERAGKPKDAIRAYHEVNLYHPLSPLVKDCVSRINSLSKKYGIYPDAASAEDTFNKAMVFYNFGDFNSAAFILRKIVTSYKGSELWEDALFKLAMCDYKKMRLKSAIARFKICVERGGKTAPAAQFFIAFAYGKGGYFYQTLDSLNKVIANYPSSQYADQASYYLGYYYEANGYKDTALEQYQRFTEQFPKSEFLDDAYWKMGRLYYFKKDYSRACDLFSRAIDSCGSGDWLDACAYWEGLCYEKMDNKWDAVASFQYVLSRFDHTYYSYRARQKLTAYGIDVKEGSSVRIESPAISETYANVADNSFAEEPLPFESFSEEDSYPVLQTSSYRITNLNEHFLKYSELMSIGFYEEAANEAALLVENSPPDKKTSAKLAFASANFASGKIRDSILYAETLCNSSIISGTYNQLSPLTWQLAYPRGYYKHVSEYARQFGLDEFLVLAVIREESRFNPKTISWANARGLMQIIPQTGRNVARLVGIKSYYTNKLHDPDVNIKMGCYYLSQLLKRFNNDKVLALAAYNGGPLRVKKWMNKWQSQSGPDIDIDEFIESIPLSETKRYVQKVMKSYYEYKRLYSTRPLPEG